MRLGYQRGPLLVMLLLRMEISWLPWLQCLTGGGKNCMWDWVLFPISPRMFPVKRSERVEKQKSSALRRRTKMQLRVICLSEFLCVETIIEMLRL